MKNNNGELRGGGEMEKKSLVTSTMYFKALDAIVVLLPLACSLYSVYWLSSVCVCFLFLFFWGVVLERERGERLSCYFWWFWVPFKL